MNETRFTKPGAVADAQPRDASTVILLRDADEARGFEALLLKRHGKSTFMGGAFVFPGGKVDDADSDAQIDQAILDRLTAEVSVREGRVPSTSLATGLAIAAVREVREETGLEITLDALKVWAHWITPSKEPRRYDTQFFVARAPHDQGVALDNESTEFAWMTPADAVGRHERGELFLPPPTLITLMELGRHSSVDEVLAAAGRRKVSPILPKLGAIDDALAILMPWDPLYATTEGESTRFSGEKSAVSRVVFDGSRWHALDITATTT